LHEPLVEWAWPCSRELLDVAAGGRLRVRGITLLNGATTTAPGGGIRNAGTLVLDHVTLSGNTAANIGGGTANSGTTTLIRTFVRFNQAIGNATAGGGIQNAAGTVTLRASLVTTNSPGNCAPAGSVPGCAPNRSRRRRHR
jgi:hypothetical protein